MTRERLDRLMAMRGLAESREQAQRLIRAGLVRAGGHRMTKPGHTVDESTVIALEQRPRFVSRGGEKLEVAFRTFGLHVEGLACLDVGASTGGFTDCLLQHGAGSVTAVDVGRGQIAWRLRRDDRVVLRERLNARYLTAADLPQPPGFAAVDVSFISLTKILPAVTQVLSAGAHMVTLIKPQFEAERSQVERGGVVRRPEVRAAAAEKVRRFGTGELGLNWIEACDCPVRGPAGNIEILAHWRKANVDR